MLGAVITSFVSGQFVSRTGRYRPNAVVGPIVLATGLLLLSRMDVAHDERARRPGTWSSPGSGSG